MSFWNYSNIVFQRLKYYDILVNTINCKYAWKCDKKHIKNLYKRNIRRNHLEIGPGTGYFIKPYKFNNLTLVDVNNDILEYVSNQHACKYIRQNLFLSKEKINLLDNSSVGVNCVLHCVPGKLEDKIKNLIDSFSDRNIVIFGSSVVNDSTSNFLSNFELKIQ